MAGGMACQRALIHEVATVFSSRFGQVDAQPEEVCCAVLFIGGDWAEAHHDIEVLDEDGRRLVRCRLSEGVEGLAALHGLIADHLLAEDLQADRW